MSKILVFIPCFRCEKQIERVLYNFKTSNIPADLLIIDNISPDNTLQKAQEAILKHQIENVTILKNKSNYNLGGSHKIAFKHAVAHDYTHVIVLHGDDQANIQDVIPFLKAGYHHQYDCLLGSRFHPNSVLKGYSLIRILGNRFLNVFCSLVCRDSISDMGSGLNVYKTEFLKDDRYLNFPDNLTFNISLLFHAYLKPASVLFFPISWREEDQISNAKVLRQTYIILNRILSTLKNPLSLYDGSIIEYGTEVYYKK